MDKPIAASASVARSLVIGLSEYPEAIAADGLNWFHPPSFPFKGSTMSMNLQSLLQAVNSSSVIRYSVKLAPLSSDGMVFPATYAPKRGEKTDLPEIALHKAYVDGEPHEIVVLDSPQSQSNRIEQALLGAHRTERIFYPDIIIEFPPEMREPSLSVLNLSHRIYDAALRASNLDLEPFFATKIGHAILESRPDKATALFEHAPITLVLGGWDSHGGRGPLSAKVQRLLTSEIIGLDAQPVFLSASKIDAMDIRKEAGKLFKTKDPIRRFELQPKNEQDKPTDPSQLGFGNIPATAIRRGVVISSAIQTSVLSCSGLRRLSFPSDNGKTTPERDQAGQAVLAALALYGLFAQNETGYLLRSRCELVPKDDGQLELIGRTLKDVTNAALSADNALALLKQALEYAAKFDLKFRPEVLCLTADDRLVELVKRSRAAALTEEL